MIYSNLIYRRNILQCGCKRIISTLKMKGIRKELSTDTKVGHKKDATVILKEVDKFRKYSSKWWKTDSEFEALQTLNNLRVPTICELLNKEISFKSLKTLSGFKILDVGCGGGILSEPLARLGGDVLGIDPLDENVINAINHQQTQCDELLLRYETTTVGDLVSSYSNTFDLVVASEVIEHVTEQNLFVSQCCELVKPGGYVVFTTINRTMLSLLLVKYASEYLLRIVPPETHNADQFVTPGELTDYIQGSHMYKVNFRGMIMNPLNLRWSWNDSTMMNYMCHAQKPLVHL